MRLLALSTAAFTAVLTELLPAGLLPEMSRSLGVSQAQVGFLVTGYAVASFLAAIPVTAALRSLPRRPVLVGVLAGFAVLNALTAWSESYPLTFVVRVLAGVMGGTLWAMLVSYAARLVPAERRGRAIAIVSAGITVALSLGIPAGTALSAALGWRAGFAVLAGLAVVLVAWVLWRVPDLPGEPAASRTPLLRVALMPGVRTSLAVTLVVLLGHQAVYTYIAPLAQRAGFGETSVVLLVFGLSTVAGIWVVGALIDRHLRVTLLGVLALVAVAMLGLAVDQAVLVAVAVWGGRSAGCPRCCRPP